MKGLLLSIILGLILNLAYAISIQDIPDSITNRLTNLDNNEKAIFLTNQAWIHRQSDPKLSVNIASYALTFCNENKLQDRIPQLYNYLGNIYLNYLHDINSSIPYLQKAREFSVQYNDSIELGFAYNNLGELYYLTNNLPLAIEYDSKSNQIFKNLNHKVGIANSLINLGKAYNAINDYEDALKCFNNLYAVETELDNQQGVARSYLEIGHTYYNRKEYDKAISYFQIALEYKDEFILNNFEANCLTGIANVHVINKDFTKALELAEKAMSLNNYDPYVPGIIDNKLDFALLFSKMNKRKEGEKNLNEAISLANKIGFYKYILQAYHTKAKFFNNLEEYKLSIISYEEYISIYSDYYSIQSSDMLNEMYENLDAQLSVEKISRELEIRQVQRNFILTILSLVLILGFIVIWRNRIISKLNKKLVETIATKDKLFSIIAHDLKTPFNSLLGFSELLKEDLEQKNYDNAEKYAAHMLKTSKDTFSLVTNLLNWSRTQRGIFKLNIESFNLQEIVDEVISINTTQAEFKNIQFTRTEFSEIIASADRYCIYTIVSNLVSNAIKFTPNNGQITFKTEVENSFIELSIIDNGVGIKDEILKNIFNIKTSKSTPGTNNEKGTGLGLIICKEFSEMNGGTILIESELGKGSTFKVLIAKAENS